MDASQIMSRDQNVGHNHIIKIDKSFERVEEFRYLGTTITDQNSIQEEIKIRLRYLTTLPQLLKLCSGDDGWMSMEQCWNDKRKEKT
jgi:hypothetical protein